LNAAARGAPPNDAVMASDPASNPTTIATRRHRALIIVRSIALLLGIVGAIALCQQVGLMIAMQDLMGWTVMWEDGSWFARALAFLVPALLLYLLDRRIVRWLIPVQRRECHECGYPLRGLHGATTRCPECGTTIASAPSDQTAARK